MAESKRSKSTHVTVEPSVISFDLEAEEPVSTLTIKNKLDTSVAFKIKTTEPKRYLVRPNQDVLGALAECTVKIILQRRERSSLVKEHSSGEQAPSPDKFLVQTTKVDDEMFETVRRVDVKTQTAMMQSMWKTKGRKETQNTRLQCQFQFPNTTSPAKSVAGSSFENPKVTSPGGESADSSVPEAFTAAQYRELVEFTVQLTAERDQFKMQAKDAKEELQLFKQNVGAARSDAVGNLGKSLEASAPGRGERVHDVVPVSGGFSLWHILLAIVMSFLFARLVSPPSLPL